MRKSVIESSSSTYHRKSRRLEQLASLLRQEIGQILLRELEVPKDTLLTISKVEIAADLSVTKVGVSILPFIEQEKVWRILQPVIPEVQRLLNEKLKLYRVPKLVFYKDDTEERAGHIESVLDKLS